MIKIHHDDGPFLFHLAAHCSAGDTGSMQILLSAEQRFAAPPEHVFALALDPVRFVQAFRGVGPIPALTRIERLGAPALGAERAVHSADGAVLHERITAFVPAQRHAYTLSGLRPPLAWLVRKAEADWRFDGDGDSTQVRWTYVFALTTPFAWPLASPLLKVFMQRAMRDCLRALAADLVGSGCSAPCDGFGTA